MFIVQATGVSSKCLTRLKSDCSYKRSSLFGRIISDEGEKSFIALRPGVLALISGTDGLDQEGHLSAHIVVKQLVLLISCRLG